MKALFLLALIALPLAAAGEDAVSTTSYGSLYQVLAPAAVINARDKLVAIERIESKIPNVAAKDIRVVIRAKAGPIAVPIGPIGRVDFPVTDALRSEDPPVETNQPKGSLALTVNVGLRCPDKLRMPWSDVEVGLAQVRELYSANASAGMAPSAVRGIEVQFLPGAAATLTIEGKDERLLMADPDGRLVVTQSMIAEKENPTLAFSRAPEFVVPYADEKR